MYMYDKGLHTFPQLLHLGIMHLCVVFVRCGKTLVIRDNRVRRRYIRILLFVCLFGIWKSFVDLGELDKIGFC